MVSGEFPHEKLKEESDALTLRLHLPADDSVIVKLWQRPGARGVLRRLTRTDPASREHHALERLHRSGIPVPLPLGISRIEIDGLPFTDAFFLQDLGPCQTALHHLQLLIRAGHERAVAGFLDEVVELTAAVVEARVIDTDHHLNNMVVTAEGRLVRLDTELARAYRSPPAGPYGEMLGRLVGSLVFAVQPEVERAIGFAESLTRRLEPGDAVLRAASAQVERMLAGQRRHRGLDTQVALPWPRA
jgi:hypothetical protein